MFSVTTPKRLRSRTSEFSDLLRLTPHDRPPLPGHTPNPATPETQDKPKRRLGFLTRKKTHASLATAAVAQAPAPASASPGLSECQLSPERPRKGLPISVSPHLSSIAGSTSSTSLPPLNIPPSLSPIMQEVLNASAPQPSPSKPRIMATGVSSTHSLPVISTPSGSSTISQHPFASMRYESRDGANTMHSPNDISSSSTISPTPSPFQTAKSGPLSALADVSAESDRPLAVVRQKLAMQFPLPPASPVTMKHSTLAAQAEADSAAQRRKRLSASVVAELQRVLGTDVELESASDGELGSPHLAYELAMPILLVPENITSGCSVPSSMGAARRISERPDDSTGTLPRQVRAPPTIPLPPPPAHARNSPTKRHAVSIQLPAKTPQARARSSTVTSLSSEDRPAAPGARPRLPNRKVSITIPSARHAPAPDAERPGPAPQLRAALEHQRTQLDAVTRELRAARAAHAAERVALLARIDALERDARRRERERALAAPATALAAHLRADSASSQYSVESVVAVASELAGFLHTSPPPLFRRSVLGVPDEHATPDLHAPASARRKSSPVILCSPFPPLSDVLGALDPLAALIAADGLGPLASASLPSLSSSSTVSSMLSSIAESPVLPDHPPLARKAPPVGFRSMMSSGKPVIVEDGKDLPSEWAVVG